MMYSKNMLKTVAKLILSMLMFSISLSAQFSGGIGTEEDPYIIITAEELNMVRDYSSSHFLLRSDIDLDIAPFNEGEGWEPIGEGFDGFNGVFNGGGYTIHGLYINRPETDRVGFFARVCGRNGSGLVENLFLSDIDVTGNNEVGGLVGSMAESEPAILRCGVSGRIRGSDKVGGLIGDALRSIAALDSYSECDVNGNNRVGGFIGYSTDSSIEGSYSSGRVIGINEIGGFIGYNLRTAVRNCYSVSGVEGNDQVGGFAGYSRDNNRADREIFHCYSAGRIVGEERVGGFIGNHLRATDVTATYWDTQASGMDESPVGEGRTTNEMTYPYAGEPRTYAEWDFDELWVHDEARRVNDGYPYLYYQSAPGADLDIPQVVIDIIEHEGNQVVRIRWQAVENALSYKVYAADIISEEDWGDPIEITDQTVYFSELGIRKFYYVVASTEEAP